MSNKASLPEAPSPTLPLKGKEWLNVPQVYYSADPKLYERLEIEAIEMRNNPTDAEKILWTKLKGKKLGYKFRRQHIINKFIVDFYCLEKGLVIEVDGEIHNEQKARDLEREDILQSLGCKVIRFTNHEVLQNIVLVINSIRKELGNAHLL
jgi:leucyl-tRNA synthetase